MENEKNNGVGVVSMMEKQLIPAGYKQTEVGVIPEDWACAESNEIMSFFGGYGFASNLSMPAGIRWLKIANVGLNEIKWDAASFLPEILVNEYKDYLLNPSDVVMALTRPILNDSLKVARIKETDVPAFLNQRVAKIITKSYHQLDYLYYVVQRLNFVAAMNLAMAGTDPPNIGTIALGKIRVAIPPTKEEQTAIANALSDVDALIAALEKLINKKSAIKTAAMQQLLTGKKRLPPFDQLNTGYKQTELGEIPGDWEVKALANTCSMKSGAGITSEGISDSGKYPCYGGNGLRGYTQSFTHDGDFALIGRQGALCGNVVSAKGQFFASEHAIVVTPHQKTNIDWLAYILYRMNLNQYSESSAQPGLSVSKLLVFKILCPSHEEQTAIANVLSDMDKDLEALQQRLHKTQQIKQGMMQELLTGKTRLVQPIG